MPRRTPTQGRAQETVDVILTACARVLVDRGYAKTTTNHVARVAGVSIGSVYQYFSNKDELVLAVVNRHAQSILDLLRSAINNVEMVPITQAIPSFVDAMLAAHAVDPKLHRVCLEHILNLGLEHILVLRETAVQLVKNYLTRKRDEVHVNDIATAAYVLVVSVDAVVQSAYLGGQHPNLSDLKRELVCLIFRYLGLT